MNFAVVEFQDRPKIKTIVSISLIKDSSGARFKPVAATDFKGTSIYQVKWQKSDLGTGSDGYYSARILCLAATLETANAKAAELNLKLAPTPLLNPSTQGTNAIHCRGDTEGDGLSSKRKRSKPVDTYTRALEDQAASNQEKGQPKKKKKKQPTESKNNELTTIMTTRNPVNKMVKDSVTARRLEDALAQARQNPLVKEAADANQNPEAKETKTDKDRSPKSDLSRAPTLPLTLATELFSDNGKILSEEQKIILSEDNDDNFGFKDQSTHPDSSGSETSESESDDVFIAYSGSEDETGQLFEENKRLSRLCAKQREELKIKLASEKALDSLRRQYYEETVALKQEAKVKDEKIKSLKKENGQLRSTIKSIFENTKHLMINKDSEQTESRSSSPTWNCGDPVSPQSQKWDLTPSVTPVSSTPVSSISSTNSSGKKVKKRGPPLNVQEIQTVCEKVLGHLNKEALLQVDEQGEVDIGLNVKINEKAMSANFKDFGNDVVKMTRHFTTLMWTNREILERSLNGLQNNKFKDAPPKQMASPPKISAILGCVKACLLNSGQKDGPILESVLKSCRTTIGSKFNTEHTKVKRRILSKDIQAEI